MANFREIVTKAIIGKAKKTSGNTFKLETEEKPNTILGCWVINNTFNGANNNGSVLITGSFDVNVWYSYDNDTKTAVSTKRFSYSDKMNVPLKNDTVLDNNSEIIVRSLKQPTVTDVQIIDGIVNLTIEKELGVEIIGNTKVKISVEDLDDDYDEIEEEVNLDTIEVNEDYLEDKKELKEE